MRLFIAVNVPDEIKEKFALAAKRLQYKINGVKWVKKENFHLTLKFLGEVKEDKVPSIVQKISEQTRLIKPFAVNFEGLGAFPDVKFPRIIWAGIKEGAAELVNLSRALDESMSDLGFPKEKREFSAHITLGRAKVPKTAEFSFENMDIAFGSFMIENIYLMRSILGVTGPEYKCEESFKFGG